MKGLFYQFIISFFSFLPIKKNKILFFSYYGNQYGCNPKYISQYLVKKNLGYKIIWAFTKPEKYNIFGIKKVKYYSFRFFYELCTSKVVITNYRMITLFKKRKNQLYIQTWHSSLRLKTIEKDAIANLPAYYIKMAQQDSQYIDCLISGCKFSTDIFKSSFWYNGLILECGTPRNDLFFSNELNIKAKITEEYNIPQTNKLILYAPTFRQTYNLEYYNVDYIKLKEALHNRFGHEWTILVRLHPHLRQYSQQLLHGKQTVDVTNYDDIQELLAVSDILISDYSSLIFDFALTKRPCFLYVPDLNEYIQKERALYFDIKQLPFIKASSNNDLLTAISTFDEKKYLSELTAFNNNIGSYENGNACERITEYINQECNK